MNFGFSGVLFGMFFVGTFASIVDKYVIGDRIMDASNNDV